MCRFIRDHLKILGNVLSIFSLPPVGKPHTDDIHLGKETQFISQLISIQFINILKIFLSITICYMLLGDTKAAVNRSI